MARRDLSTVVHNGADIIDSRDIIERIGELEDEIETAKDANETPDEDIVSELAALNKLADEGISDWHHGATLIRDSYFIDYAKELADDIGSTKVDAQWPYTCIDWEQAAKELQMDYSCVDYDGVEYWVRS